MISSSTSKILLPSDVTLHVENGIAFTITNNGRIINTKVLFPIEVIRKEAVLPIKNGKLVQIIMAKLSTLT